MSSVVSVGTTKEHKGSGYLENVLSVMPVAVGVAALGISIFGSRGKEAPVETEGADDLVANLQETETWKEAFFRMDEALSNIHKFQIIAITRNLARAYTSDSRSWTPHRIYNGRAVAEEKAYDAISKAVNNVAMPDIDYIAQSDCDGITEAAAAKKAYDTFAERCFDKAVKPRAKEISAKQLRAEGKGCLVM